MTNDDSGTTFPALFAEKMMDAGEDAARTQEQMMETMLGGSGDEGFPLDEVLRTATFKTRVQSNGRISIPDAERQALGIDEGDLVQAVIVPLGSGDSDD
ncbi:MAG: AbrB/MazE/SpoVT family DNA-binding domain-containing protein [Halobacteriales archaeon]